ncbi:MAG: hypothetical protein WC205_15005 [Opitutaceae bacterium]|jgi:hypothetical protein
MSLLWVSLTLLWPQLTAGIHVSRADAPSLLSHTEVQLVALFSDFTIEGAKKIEAQKDESLDQNDGYFHRPEANDTRPVVLSCDIVAEADSISGRPTGIDRPVSRGPPQQD